MIHKNCKDIYLLFSRHCSVGPDSENHSRQRIEEVIKTSCTVLNLGQKCADWFILPQFRVAGTMSRNLLLADEGISLRLGYGPAQSTQRIASECMKELTQSWFS